MDIHAAHTIWIVDVAAIVIVNYSYMSTNNYVVIFIPVTSVSLII